MANPRKLIRPFRGPGDVERMWRRLARTGPDWKDASPIDKATFLQAMSPAYAAYEVFHVLTEDEDDDDIFQVRLFSNGAALNTDPAGDGFGIPQERFWSSPVFAESTRQLSIPPNPEFLSGWHFLAKDITLEFFNAPPAWSRRTGHVVNIRSPNLDSGPEEPGSITNVRARYGLMGVAAYTSATFVQVFSTHGGSGPQSPSSSGATNKQIVPGWLRDFPLLPNATFWFEEIGTIGIDNIIRVTMTGEWHFSPYYMEPGEEPDR